MTNAKKERLKEQREMEKCRIDDFCHEHEIEKVEITEYQIRLNGKMDVYPTNHKFCILNSFGGKWGQYNRIEELLEKLK
jgi:hypothetical protein